MLEQAHSMFTCGSPSYLRNDCPKEVSGGVQRPLVQGRAYASDTSGPSGLEGCTVRYTSPGLEGCSVKYTSSCLRCLVVSSDLSLYFLYILSFDCKNILDCSNNIFLFGQLLGIFPISSVCTQVLFDPGSIYSFVSRCFVGLLNREIEPLDFDLSVSTFLGGNSIASSVVKACSIFIRDQELEMQGFNVILGMD